VKSGLGNRGVQAALLSAVLFGAGTPLAKLLLGTVNPWLMAGLLYCGSGAGLFLVRLIRREPRVTLARGEAWPLVGAVIAGGMAGPVLLMLGLSAMPASGASLLLNAEAVFTVALAWLVFKENVDRRIVAGMLAIVAGAVLITVPSMVSLGNPWPTAAILGACLAWGLDNNLTRKVALRDATWLAAVKGSVAGPVNLALGFALGAASPRPCWSDSSPTA
jgi:drug/metabolite transporter (DMT)-like permease